MWKYFRHDSILGRILGSSPSMNINQNPPRVIWPKTGKCRNISGNFPELNAKYSWILISDPIKLTPLTRAEHWPRYNYTITKPNNVIDKFSTNSLLLCVQLYSFVVYSTLWPPVTQIKIPRDPLLILITTSCGINFKVTEKCCDAASHDSVHLLSRDTTTEAGPAPPENFPQLCLGSLRVPGPAHLTSLLITLTWGEWKCLLKTF